MLRRVSSEADMSKLASFPGAVLLGAGLMYFLDPVRGTKRRKRMNEAVTHAERVERELFAKAARDAKHRIHGLTERVTHPQTAEVDDNVLEERVRARLGRAVSHPGAVEVVVLDGRVILRGPVLASEAEEILNAVRRVAGVHKIVDQLERHVRGDVPALQGEGRIRRKSERWSPSKQAGASGAGALLAAYGLWRGGLLGTIVGAAGGLLALRATANRPIRELVGRHAGVTVQKTITVNRPIHAVFDLWSRPDTFPLFMEHVRHVDMEAGGKKTRWTVDGPAGSKLEFEAETIELEPDRSIAWRTLPGQRIEHEGRIRFEEVPGGTRVTVLLTYCPPGGVVGHALAHLLGWDPKARMDDDLVRMKALLEEGRTRAHRQTVELADLH
jgi:uncharacterized membrane protein